MTYSMLFFTNVHIYFDIDWNFNEGFENQFIMIFVQTNVSVGLDFFFNVS